MSDWVAVAKAGEIAPGAFRVVDVDGASVVVFNLGGEYYAIEDVCTHDGGELMGGRIVGREIECPRHGARFDVITGRALSLPAVRPVRTYETRVTDGAVEVNVKN